MAGRLDRRERVAPLDRSGGASSTIISQRAIEELPVRGRNFTEFVQLSPTVVQESDRFGLVISGQRSINSNVAIDGADFNDPLQGNQRGGNETAFFFPQSAVREFQVVRSGAGAEIGRTGAGFVNVVTKSGANQPHGEAFLNLRNRTLTSADAFDRKLDNRLLSDIRFQAATDNRLEDPNSYQAQIVITGFGTLGGDTGRPRRFDARREQVAQNLTWTAGAQQLKFGWDVNITHVHQERESNTLGRYDFTSLANYLTRNISRFRQTVAAFAAEDLVYRGTGQEAAVFLQDRLDIRPGLTLNAGLRWEGQWNPQPERPNPAFPETALIPNDLTMWQPRAAMTWDATGRGRTILRLSTGVFASRTPANLFQRVTTDNGLTALAVDSRTDATILPRLVFPNALPLLPAGTRVPAQRIFGFDPGFQNPRTYQHAITLEQQIGPATQATIGFVHADARYLQRRLDRNLFPPTIDATGLPVYPATRPNTTIAQLEINDSGARGRYDALALSLGHRLASRVQMLAHYTLAYNKDDDSNERNFSRETTLNVFDTGAEYTWSKQDVRHAFNASTVIDVPGGFTAGAVLIARSGFPFTPVIGADQQRDANDDNDRAIINGRVADRNSMRQPAFFDLDLSLVKALRLGSGRKIDLMIQVFNATRASNKNFANDSVSVYGTPAAPVATAGQPLFAPSTARFGGPRQVQLGVRASF